MSDFGKITKGTVASSSPLTVRMRRATTAQAAANLGNQALTAGQDVLLAVMDDGSTYVLGNGASTGAIVLRSPNGTLYTLSVSDSASLRADPVT